MVAGRSVCILQKHVRIGDPHLTSDDADRLSILGAVYEPLVRRQPGGTYGPCLAAGLTLSAGACTWRFRLREGVYFHDGKPLTSEDVVTALRRVQSGAAGGELGTAGVFQSYLAGSSIQADGSHGVLLTTPEPTADLLDLLVDVPILSREGIEGLPEVLLGTGPYRVGARSDEAVRLVRSDCHWGKRQVPDELIWLAVEDPGDRLEMLLTEQADIAAGLHASAQHTVLRSARVRLVRAKTSVCAAFMCNLFEGPCTERKVRQALNHALDVPALIRGVMHGAAERITGPLTPLHLGFDPGVPGYAYDPVRARALLREAGCGNGCAVKLDVPTTLPDEAIELAAGMAAYYAEVGIDTQVVQHADRTAYAERVRAKRIHDAACFDSSPLSTFRILREKFHSGLRGPWWLGYKNPQLNRLVDTARATVDVSARQLLYRQAYAQLSRDAPWVFLYNPMRCIGIRADLAGWMPSIEGHITFS